MASAPGPEESLPVADVLVDGRLVGEIGEIVMRDRHRLSQDGFIVALIPVNDQNRTGRRAADRQPWLRVS